MVMVLLFLGVIFLLVGFQALSSSGGDDVAAMTSTTKVATSKTSSAKPERAAVKADVRVYNISEQEGLAGNTADQLREAGWNVTDIGNLELPDISVTTVYFGEAAGEHDAADAVGEVLHAPVAPRIPDVAEQPPGVIVVVAG